jgi:hypothetical protein
MATYIEQMIIHKSLKVEGHGDPMRERVRERQKRGEDMNRGCGSAEVEIGLWKRSRWPR